MFKLLESSKQQPWFRHQCSSTPSIPQSTLSTDGISAQMSADVPVLEKHHLYFYKMYETSIRGGI